MDLLEAFVLADEGKPESEDVPYNAHREDSLRMCVIRDGTPRTSLQWGWTSAKTAKTADIYFGVRIWLSQPNATSVNQPPLPVPLVALAAVPSHAKACGRDMSPEQFESRGRKRLVKLLFPKSILWLRGGGERSYSGGTGTKGRYKR